MVCVMSKILFLISPTINSFTDKDKGSKANRTACAYSHLKNSVSSNIEIAAAAGITAAVGHYKPVLKLETPPKINWKSPKEAAKNLIKDFKAAPRYLRIAAFAAIALSLINRTYKKIEIEHKYEDRAILEETKKEREDKLNSK